MDVRVRYAPSPTGLQHIGGVRTALFNYYFAKSRGGTFILRIEDTDRARYSEESLSDLYETLRWLGIEYDEGPRKGGDFAPYIQSERVGLYRSYAGELVEAGNAYPCFCSAERLEKLREKQKQERSSQIGYDKRCRHIDPREASERVSAGEPYVIRFKVPFSGEVKFNDLLLGEVVKKSDDITSDPVILKSDRFPTYHLANVVDDHDMKISHVMRAQEWLPSVPLHIYLYEAFGWQPPLYCHLPMVMGSDGAKLSKRHGATSLAEFKKSGYLPEAIVNYIALLGWSYDDKREFFTSSELSQCFSLEKLNKAPAIFDYKKLDWFNGHYIRSKESGELKALIEPLLAEAGLFEGVDEKRQESVVTAVIPLVKERLKHLSEAPDLVRFLFKQVEFDDLTLFVPKKMVLTDVPRLLKIGLELLDSFFEFSDQENEERFRQRAEEESLKLGQLLQPLRVAITGSGVSLPLFGSIRLLERKVIFERVEQAIAAVESACE